MKLVKILQKKMWDYNYSSEEEMKAHKEMMLQAKFEIIFESRTSKRIIYSQSLTDILNGDLL